MMTQEESAKILKWFPEEMRAKERRFNYSYSCFYVFFFFNSHYIKIPWLFTVEVYFSLCTTD